MFQVSVECFDEWRQVARDLLCRAIAPENISWQSSAQQLLAFDSEEDYLALPIIHCAPKVPRVPKDFLNLAKTIACYRDPGRWALLYCVLWRLVYEDRALLQNKVDTEVKALLSMQKSVLRDRHKMKAFVRFKKVQASPSTSVTDAFVAPEYPHEEPNADEYHVDDHYVAWFEPEHLIVQLTVPFFVKRFHNMSWSILTPDLCAHWNLHELTFTPGLARGPKINDDLEDLWREYYANIFNPARLKLKAMQSEMPKKYWINLPEAPLIAELIRNAGARVDDMLEQQPTLAWSKTAKSTFIKDKQSQLRKLRSTE